MTGLRFTAATMSEVEAERGDFLRLLNEEIAERTRRLEADAGLVRIAAGQRALIEVLGWTRPP